MNVAKTNITNLPPLQRRMADAWLARFEEGWHEQKLKEFLRSLPPESSLRQPLLVAMVQRDLTHHWQKGREITVEQYLQQFPELGGVDEIAIELIAAEYNARKEAGKAELSEFAERFPSRIDDLYVLLKPDLFDSAQPAEKTKDGDSLAQRRKLLLQTPPNEETADKLAERRKELLRSGGDEGSKLSDTALAPYKTLVASELDLVLPAAPAPASPAEKPTGEPNDARWVDIETIRSAAKAPAHMPKEAPPTNFSHFAIIKRLGADSSSVYEANDTVLNRHVVLKIPQLTDQRSEEARFRFQRETKAAAGVYHPLLCPVLEIGRTDGMDYLVMPFVEGEPLSQVLLQRTVWPARHAVLFVMKLAAALQAAHKQGACHRRIHPAKILITPSETPVIIGFGHVNGEAAPLAKDEAAYRAPEHLQGEERMGPQADVFSLGVLLFRLLAGQTPQPDLPDSAFPADVPAELRNFCHKALAANPGDRPNGMTEFVSGLNGFLGKLRSSDFDLRGSALSGSMHGRLPGSASMGLPPAPLPSSVETPVANSAFTQLQELRQISNRSTPPARHVPKARRRYPWPWYVSSALVGAAVTLVALAIFHRDPTPQPGDPGKSNPPPGQALPEPTFDELLAALEQNPPSEKRTETLAQLRSHKEAAEIEKLANRITENEWPDPASDSNPKKDAAFEALREIDAEHAANSLVLALQLKNPRIRAWACGRIAKRGAPDLVPQLRAALTDGHGLVRKAAADALRAMLVRDKETVEALERRIADDLWIKRPLVTPKEGRVDDPDYGGKRAALDALRALDAKRVPEALKKARESKDINVRLWAKQELDDMK
ncbi:MAG TPA: protein kinase [Gemmataceae bacterium]|nr:protein kinase [Gemmataceae bacterium]